MHPLAQTVLRYGLPLIFANVFLEQIGLPIPAVPTLIVAGALSVEKDIGAAQILLVALIACLIADSVWYALGNRMGFRVLKVLCRVSLSPDSCVRQTTATFERWGMPSLVVAKFIPGFSTVAPPLAGAIVRKPGAFLFYDGLGSLLWAGAAVLAGRIFHSAIDRALEFLAGVGARALILVGAALALFILAKWWQRRRFYKALRMARISVDQLQALMGKDPPPVVVDVRTIGARSAEPRQIPGARLMEFAEIEEKAKDLPPEREIILYCT